MGTLGKRWVHTKETKEKLRLSKLGSKNPMFGKVFSSSHRQKISDAMKGRMPKNIKLFLSSKNREKALKAFRERIIPIKELELKSERMRGKLNPFWGKKHTQETINKVISAHKGIPSPLRGRKRMDMTGENNWNWKGGKETVKARKVFYERKRQSLKKVNSGKHSFEQWQELKAKYGFMCLCCKKVEPEIKLTQDHIIPLDKWRAYIQFHPEIKYGCDDMENIQPLCGSCNGKKATKIINFINQL